MFFEKFVKPFGPPPPTYLMYAPLEQNAKESNKGQFFLSNVLLENEKIRKGYHVKTLN